MRTKLEEKEKENGSETITRTRSYAIAGIVAIAIALIAAMMVMPASATTVTIAPSDADAWVDQYHGDTNFGTRDYFRVRSRENSNYRGLVHFDLSSLPAGVTIESTILYLRITSINGVDRTHNAHRVTADWTETGVTWNNQPSYDSTATDSVSTGSASETWVEWNVTSDVQLFVDGTQNYGWLIKDAVEDKGFPPRGWDYYSREKGDYRCPKLEVTYTEGGEPVDIDVKPGSCPNPLNLKSKGVLPVAVLGTAEFDVTTIDPGTILLTREGCEGVAAIRWSYKDIATPFTGELCDCNDLNGDSYIDLTLKFDTQELVSKLELDNVAGETIPLTVTGNLNAENGGTIEGKDCIRVQ